MLKKNLTSLFIISALVLLFSVSCMKVDDSRYLAQEQANIDNYLNSNPSLFYEQKESGLYYLEVAPGAGNVISEADTAYIIYTCKFLSGYVVDTNIGRDTFKIVLNTHALIPGFEEAISYMREGGRSYCVIPSKLAYGKLGSQPYIPGYTPLFFDIKLAKIKKGPSK